MTQGHICVYIYIYIYIYVYILPIASCLLYFGIGLLLIAVQHESTLIHLAALLNSFQLKEQAQEIGQESANIRARNRANY